MPEEGWTPTANSAARNYKLTWKARGLLTELLSYPDGWDTSVDELVAQAERAGGKAEGRHAMRAAMRELVSAGYVRRIKTQDDRGRWVTGLSVSDDPTHHRGQENRTSVDRTSAHRPSAVRTSADRALIQKTETNTVKNTDLRSSDQHSASLAALAAGAHAPAEDLSEKRLYRLYSMIDAMSPLDNRDQLLTIERKRPRIYREARRKALHQIKTGNDPDRLNDQGASNTIDQLSYKYVVLHYKPDWPIWLIRLLERKQSPAARRAS